MTMLRFKPANSCGETDRPIDPYPERFMRFLKEEIGFSHPQIEELLNRFGEALVRDHAIARRQP